MAIITPGVVDDLAKKGKIVAGSRIDLAKVGMGVAIKEGAPLPTSAPSMPSSARRWPPNRSPTSTPRPAARAASISTSCWIGWASPIRCAPKAKLKAGRLRRRAGRQRGSRNRHAPDQRDRARQGRDVGRPAAGRDPEYYLYAGGIGAAAKDGAAAKALVAFLAGPARSIRAFSRARACRSLNAMGVRPLASDGAANISNGEASGGV